MLANEWGTEKWVEEDRWYTLQNGMNAKYLFAYHLLWLISVIKKKTVEKKLFAFKMRGNILHVCFFAFQFTSEV